MTLVDTDVYRALCAAGIPEKLASQAAAAVCARTHRWEAWRPMLWPLGAVGVMVAATAVWFSVLWLLFTTPTFGPASVTCYSNGTMIYQGRSAGAVDRGYYWTEFRDAAGHRTRIRADCIVIYDDPDREAGRINFQGMRQWARQSGAHMIRQAYMPHGRVVTVRVPRRLQQRLAALAKADGFPLEEWVSLGLEAPQLFAGWDAGARRMAIRYYAARRRHGQHSRVEKG